MGGFQLTRCEQNPILKPNPINDWEARVVLNPAVCYEDGTFYLLYRAAGNDKQHLIHIGLATSKDGVTFERVSDKPVLSPKLWDFDGGCIEDPRIVKIDGVYYLTYAYRPFPPGQYWIRSSSPVEDYGVSPQAPQKMVENSSGTALAMTSDFKHFKRLGRITKASLDDRDVYLFPEKVNGKYVRLSRPMQWCGEGFPCESPAIWINYSEDIMDWDEKNTKLLFKSEFWWEEKKIGGSTPPVRTDQGWLLLYHGVDKDGIYRVGAALLDLEKPDQVIARTKDYILEPEMPYEKSGVYNGCVFPTGNVVIDGKMYIYYGAADQFCCLATCDLNELVEYTLSFNH